MQKARRNAPGFLLREVDEVPRLSATPTWALQPKRRGILLLNGSLWADDITPGARYPAETITAPAGTVTGSEPREETANSTNGGTVPPVAGRHKIAGARNLGDHFGVGGVRARQQPGFHGLFNLVVGR